MRETQELYGSDIDGNRGIMITEYEIDDDDFDNIRDILFEEVDETISFDEEVLITLYGSNDEEVEFEVNIADYISVEEYNDITELP